MLPVPAPLSSADAGLNRSPPAAEPIQTEPLQIEILPPGADPAALRRLEKLAHLLDSAFRIPGTSLRFGLDAALGVIPVAGDLAAKAVSAWMLVEAWRLRLPPRLLGRMIGNLAIDAAVGSIPVVGDAADFFLKANNRNLKIIHDYLRAPGLVGEATAAG